LNRNAPIRWPHGRRFAFTITDDTDRALLPQIRPVYDLLLENGILPTKTVWPLRPLGKPVTGGDTLEDRDYARWIMELRALGVEIALHGVADGSSSRDRVIDGLTAFRELLGHDPTMHINHVGQREALYWGPARLDPPLSWAYQTYRKFRGRQDPYEGHIAGSKYFWGDLAQARIRYVRNLVWRDINTLKMDSLMPYHDPRRPYVRYWFSGSNGSSLNGFCRLLSEENQDRLAAEGGASIVYTHLGSGFYPISQEFKRLVRRLAGLNGWFVPASALLDYVGEQRGWKNLANHRGEHLLAQARWLLDRATPARNS